MDERAWAVGLAPTYQRMSRTQTDTFVVASMAEAVAEEDVPEAEEAFLVQVLNKRIEVHNLPISFSGPAKMAVLALTDRPGSVVALLIDCLNAYEGQKVTVEKLADLYPTGFYDEDTLIRYADQYLKTRKVKWSDLY